MIQQQVPLQEVEIPGQRFEGNNLSTLSDQHGRQQRVETDVCPNVKNDGVPLDNRLEGTTLLHLIGAQPAAMVA